MNWIGYQVRAWIGNACSGKGLAEFFSALGALSSIGWVASLFYSELKLSWWGILSVVLVSIGHVLYKCRPQLVFSHKLSGRDVSIELVVGDIMSFPGTLIIGSNTTFDTHISPRLISARSIQGLFTRKYYSDESQLDAEISSQLATSPNEHLHGQRLGKSTRYKVGTCLTLRPRGRTAYLLAIAGINEHGIASGTFADLQNALTQLWQYIGTHGSKEHLLIPIVGTGYTRLTESREMIIREIILSFLAACTERTFADKLSIVIFPQDMLLHDISLDELDCYLKVHCQYHQHEKGSRPPTGTPV